MNSHSDIRKLLSPYSGDDISSHDRTLVEEHLKICPDCRSELAELQTTLKLLRTTPEIEPPLWLTTRIMANVREQRELKPSWLKRIFFPLHIKLPIEGLALLFVCMTGFYLSQRVGTELLQPASEKGDKMFAVPPPVRTPQTPAMKSLKTSPLSPSKDVPAVSVPKAAEPPVAADKPVAPPAFAPSPSAIRENADFSGAQENRSMAEPHRTASKAEVTPTQLTIRMNVTTTTEAFLLIREAVIRSGGAIIHEPPAATSLITALIPINRVDELFINLGKIGKIVEQPHYSNRSGTAEVNIVW